MKVCYVSPEAFAWGIYGGFGYVTRTLASEVAKRGIETSIVTVRRQGQAEIEEIDGVIVHGYPIGCIGPDLIRTLASKCNSLSYYRNADADIYHSQEVSFNTLMAQCGAPEKAHVITFQDPYNENEWGRISKVEPKYTMTHVFKARLWAEKQILTSVCKRANALYSQARFIARRAKKLYKLSEEPKFLPNPVYIPHRKMQKADTATICFLARWDPQKRVELFLRLAKEFPSVNFIAMGRGHNLVIDQALRNTYGSIENLNLVGFVTEKEKSRILEESWALVNTSIREALPVSFLEALAHETPIISGEDPDRITSNFGFKVEDDDYASALDQLLNSEDWREKGKKGRAMIEEVYDVDKVVDCHIRAYEDVLGEA